MTHTPSIFPAALALAEQRASAESYLLRVVLSSPVETSAVLRLAGARPDTLSQPDYQIMLAETLSLSERRQRCTQLDVLRNVMVGLREAGYWRERGIITRGMRWTVRGLWAFASWFNPARLITGRAIAARSAVVAWRRVEVLAFYSRQAERCLVEAERITRAAIEVMA